MDGAGTVGSWTKFGAGVGVWVGVWAGVGFRVRVESLGNKLVKQEGTTGVWTEVTSSRGAGAVGM